MRKIFTLLCLLICSSIVNAGEIRYVDNYCSTPNVYDQTCLSNALNGISPNNSTKVILAKRTYTFTAPIIKNNLSNITIGGYGNQTILKGDGVIFQCIGCQQLRVLNFRVETITVPVIKTPAQLPTATVNIAIDRWGTGLGYLPTVNDYDLLLSPAQLNQSWDAYLQFNECSYCTIQGITGKWISIMFYDSNNILVRNNKIHAGKGIGGIGFWRAGLLSAGNNNIYIEGNEVKYSAFSGIMVAATENATITKNKLIYVGESGIKTYQNFPYQVHNAKISYNNIRYSWFDGLDLSSNDPHTGEYQADSIAEYNTSEYNHGTGAFTDGKNWIIRQNVFRGNYKSGLSSDLLYSNISGNLLDNNNTSNNANEHHLIFGSGVPPVGNVAKDNRIINFNSPASYCIFINAPGLNTYINNTCSGGDIFIN